MAGADLPPKALAILFLVSETKLLKREKSPPNPLLFSGLLSAVEGATCASGAGGAATATSVVGALDAWAIAAQVRIMIESRLNFIVGYSKSTSVL
jgi:hypothetical protein